VHILYLVATPIGNLQDISPRALDTLRGVALIAAEDTRTAKQLLNYFDIHTPVTSFFEHSKQNKINHILDALQENDVAVISEAGTPGINDPGYELVREAIARGYRVSPIPGASAVLTALVASGISANAFYYVGFLPREPQARRKFLRELVNERDTIVAFETPHRLRDALKDLENIFGAARKICVARELTKKFEEFQRGTIGEVREHFEKNEPRGEFTLVIAGATADNGRRTTNVVWDDARIVKEMRALLKKGVPRTEAVKRIAKASGRERRAVYEMMLNESR
jgi:16S rRNA (cytidine1402-2'-O)-methyltransferase